MYFWGTSFPMLVTSSLVSVWTYCHLEDFVDYGKRHQNRKPYIWERKILLIYSSLFNKIFYIGTFAYGQLPGQYES